MNYCQRIVLALALLSLASVQTGCIEMTSMTQISLNDWPRNLPDVARLARCSEIKVAIANPPGSVLYGELNAGVVSGYVIHDTEIDREAMGRIDNQVGQIFADHLQRAFPDKRVSYNLTNLESSVRRPDQPAQVQDSSAICLLSYMYIIHFPRSRFHKAEFYKTLRCDVTVVEPSPPLFLPGEQAYVSGMGWARDRAFWSADSGSGAVQDTTSHPKYSLGPVAEVKVFAPNVSRPMSVRLDYERLERAMLVWANERASGLVRQLRDALRKSAYGG